MTGQALERITPGLPMMPGKVERCEFEFAGFLGNLLERATPATRWDVLCDNLDIYLSDRSSAWSPAIAVSNATSAPKASPAYLPRASRSRRRWRPSLLLVFIQLARPSPPPPHIEHGIHVARLHSPHLGHREISIWKNSIAASVYAHRRCAIGSRPQPAHDTATAGWPSNFSSSRASDHSSS
jgi:hypothetical protein